MVGFGCCGEEVKAPGKLIEQMRKGGYLDEDGICAFNIEDQAHPSGSVAPGGFWESNPSAEDIEDAIKVGIIKFIDGNGDRTKAMTKKEYIKKYPNYWPPDMVLKMTNRLPPGKVKRFIKLSSY